MSGSGPQPIRVHGARENNLRDVNVEIPRYSLTVLTGPSGSGKSSLAFDTLFAEGRRRYVESLSSQARQLFGELRKPDVDLVEGLSPAVAVDQHSTSAGPRSTVGTLSEIGNFLRLLYARVGELGDGGAFLMDAEAIRARLESLPAGTKLSLLAPVLDERKGAQKRLLDQLRREGLVKLRVNGELRDLDEELRLEPGRRNSVEAVVDRLVTGDKSRRRLAASLERTLALGGGRLRALVELPVERGNGSQKVRESKMEVWDLALAKDGQRALPEVSPSLFSFNSRRGACPDCQGLGKNRRVREALLVADPARSLAAGAMPILAGARGAWLLAQIEALGTQLGFTLATPWQDIPPAARATLLGGSQRGELDIQLRSPRGRVRKTFPGLIPYLERRHAETHSAALRRSIEALMGDAPCPACSGRRLSPDALRVTLGGRNIAELSALPLGALGAALAALRFYGPRQAVAAQLLPEIQLRLDFLGRVGLGYLSLDRPAATLSGGERQRLALAEQVGAAMTGVLYILDEPSIGLHPRDQQALLGLLATLRDRGNTVLVVEHDRETIECADWVIDLGPGAGELGGRVVAVGTPAAIRAHPDSPTGRSLRAASDWRPRPARPPGADWLRIEGATRNNLKGIDVAIPLGRLTCVTGVSGSGKSSLVRDTLYRHLARGLGLAAGEPGPCRALRGGELVDDVINVDQAPIGRSPRSNPATYAGLWNEVRRLYAALPESRLRGYGPGRFSFNVKGGRCEHCLGDGERKVALHFLPPAAVPCEVCRGRRFNRETLEIHYRGRSIAEVLAMTVAQARVHFSEIPALARGLGVLAEVGLGYLRLGQSALSLSGGEAQRLKLAKELARRTRGRAVYILDEPSTGLHFQDVATLMGILQRLVDKGHTVIIIEHNPDIIREADWLLDLGPDGGPDGGELLFAGPPAEILSCPRSYTGAILRGLPRARHDEDR